MPSAQRCVEALAALGNDRIGGGQVFGTWTFRDPAPRAGSPYFTSIGHAGGARAIGKYLVGLAELYPGLAAFVAMEPHQDRVAPHFHGLLGGLPSDVPPAVEAGRMPMPAGAGAAPAARGSLEARLAREWLWESWWRDHGLARLEAVDGDGAALYVSKYSLKGGDQVPWWRIWEPGELRNEWIHARRARRLRG